MKKKLQQLLTAVLVSAGFILLIPYSGESQLLTPAEIKLPSTPRLPVTDTYFGMKVTDNYRWLENLQDTVVKKWLEEQDAYTENKFDRITGRDQLLAECRSGRNHKNRNKRFGDQQIIYQLAAKCPVPV